MKYLHIAVLLVTIGSFTAYAQDITLSSPNDINKINIFIGENISYEVIHRDQKILERSPMSITINGRELGVNPRARSPRRRAVDQLINPVVKVKRAQIRDHFNEIEIPFRGGYSVIFRAYDDGVAYRFRTNLKGLITVDSENVSYNFPLNHSATFPIADGYYTHYERGSTTQNINDLSDDQFSCLPVLIARESGQKMVITEADLYDYPGYYLEKGGESALQSTFPRYPKTYKASTDRDVIPELREDFIARTNGRRVYPWRLMVISDNDAELLQNEMVYKLSRPLMLSDVSWIKPGKVAWDWYNANNVFGVDFQSGINTDTYKYYIDFAAKYNLDYVILDEGWYDIKTNDLIHPVPSIDMPALAAYGKEKSVDLILWVTWKALEDNLAGALEQFSDWGIKGIKVDFMQRDDQWMVQYYEKVAKAAAEHHMLVDYHGSYKPSGLRRAYPNVISREGVRGLEQHKWVGQFANPENDLIIPFTRQLAGPMDYTPGAMRNAQKANYQPIFNRPMSLGTRCHQLAMYVIYESPLQMLADAPSNYLNEEECMEFLSKVPTVWDETEILEASFGDYIVTARKHGENWYVGAMTDWDARDLKLDLSFLEEGNYQIQYYQDGINAENYASDYKMIKQEVSSKDTFNIHLASGGGWAAMIIKQP